jgi:hypothetical protein
MTRRPGRPPLNVADPSIHVGLRLPTKQYDALYQRATAARMNVSEFIRSKIENRSTKIGPIKPGR